MYDLSILIPAIRQNRWLELYNSLEKACKNHTWQLVFVSPFDLIDELKDKTNIKMVKDYGSVTRAIQIGMLHLDSDLVYLTVDDCVFAEDSLDISIEQYKRECSDTDVLCVRYKEANDIQNANYYRVTSHGDFAGLNINYNWLLAPQFLMNRHYFIELGGFNCIYEYMNEPVHDFMFRLQSLGNKIVISDVHACEATHYPGTIGDHGPIHFAQTTHDFPIFARHYRTQNPTSPTHINYDNWSQSPAIWERRFGDKVPDTFDDLIKEKNYVY